MYVTDIGFDDPVPAGSYEIGQFFLFNTAGDRTTAPVLGTVKVSDRMMCTGAGDQATATWILQTIIEDPLIWRLDVTNTAQGTPFTSFWEQKALDVESAMESVLPIFNLTRFYPQLVGSGDLSVTVGGTDAPGGPLSTIAAANFTIGVDYKIDVRTSHRYLYIRGEMTETGFWQLTGLDAEITERSAR